MKIALLQILPAGSADENRKKGEEYCRRAKAAGADIALFPEMWSCGYRIPECAEELKRLALPADGAFVRSFAELARESDMAIGVTFLEKFEPSPKNSLCLFDRFGHEALHYSKVHTCDFGEEKYLTAGEDFFVCDLDTREGAVKVGAMICYDREFPESARILMLKGAEVVLVPNACPMEINRLSQLRGRAYENMIAVATANYPAGHPTATGIPRCSTARRIFRATSVRAIPAYWRRAKKRGCTLRTSICGRCARTGKAKCTATPTAAPKSTGCSFRRK